MRINFKQLCDTGLVRSVNQDSIYCNAKNDYGIFVVADGKGLEVNVQDRLQSMDELYFALYGENISDSIKSKPSAVNTYDTEIINYEDTYTDFIDEPDGNGGYTGKKVEGTVFYGYAGTMVMGLKGNSIYVYRAYTDNNDELVSIKYSVECSDFTQGSNPTEITNPYEVVQYILYSVTSYSAEGYSGPSDPIYYKGELYQDLTLR